MAFPIPSLLSSIETLLKEVDSLDGLILVSGSREARFVSISQLDSLLLRLRTHPEGDVVAEVLYNSLQDSFREDSAKPVLILQDDGSYWLGLMGLNHRKIIQNNLTEHLDRCYSLS